MIRALKRLNNHRYLPIIIIKYLGIPQQRESLSLIEGVSTHRYIVQYVITKVLKK